MRMQVLFMITILVAAHALSTPVRAQSLRVTPPAGLTPIVPPPYVVTGSGGILQSSSLQPVIVVPPPPPAIHAEPPHPHLDECVTQSDVNCERNDVN